ncbi:Sec-independent protein translocase protein TatB [Thiobacillus denitrificans]|jgi:sec-independent protein translocase protein TatB|uniref:Sec-independent protein translocase protein TatB n=1 Tax=Thiobacillus denitrificans TaxID=36861 RepID=UPI0003710098|nr:Sec-independent protein translocase protein TatB [Thiobacillus denitrificans]
MFDIGFTELIVIGVIALIVIGPERLPKVARTAGHLYGRMQRYVSSVKSDISHEMQLDEIRRVGVEIKNSAELAALDAKQQVSVVDDYLRDEASSINKALTATAAAATAGESPVNEPAQETPEPVVQQSLPLDEPDQNLAADAPPAVTEPADGETTGKSA